MRWRTRCCMQLVSLHRIIILLSPDADGFVTQKHRKSKIKNREREKCWIKQENSRKLAIFKGKGENLSNLTLKPSRKKISRFTPSWCTKKEARKEVSHHRFSIIIPCTWAFKVNIETRTEKTFNELSGAFKAFRVMYELQAEKGERDKGNFRDILLP